MQAAGPVLSDRALNRALLARQGLITGWQIPVIEAIQRLVGMQSQSPTAPYTGFWGRLYSFEPNQLGDRLLDRSVVRIALMRSTIQLVTARDCLALRPVLQSSIEA